MNTKTRIITSSVIVALGGFLLGFDSAIISGINPILKDFYNLNDIQLGWSVGSCLFGALLGNSITGMVSSAIGRKRTLLITAILFFTSSILSAYAPSFTMFVIARILGGLGIGMSILTAPMYIAEIAPPAMRGRLVSINQLNIVIGISLSFFSNRIIYNIFEIDVSWRWMLGVGALPAFIYFVLLFFIFESPRWLVLKNKDIKAFEVLKKISLSSDTVNEFNEIKQSLSSNQKVTYSEFFSKKMRFVILIGIIVAFFQQITGINAVLYYAPTIIEKSGIGRDSALTQAIFVGLANLAFTLVAMRCIDKIGRKPLLIIGSAGICCSHLVLGIAFMYTAINSYIILAAVIAFVAFFAISWGPVMWVLLSEIYPNKYRGMGISVAGLLGGIISFLISLIFPWELQNVGTSGTFFIFALFALISLVVVKLYIPETKGKSLEMLGEELTKEPGVQSPKQVNR